MLLLQGALPHGQPIGCAALVSCVSAGGHAMLGTKAVSSASAGRYSNSFVREWFLVDMLYIWVWIDIH